jgi:hypothetical protein
MSYRLHDEIDNGDADGELPGRSRHGAHSSDRLGAESGLRPYTYERPAGSTGRSRHAAPDDNHSSAAEFSWREPTTSSPRSWETESYSCETGSHSYHTGADEPAASGYGGANYGADGYGGTNYDAAGYGGLNYEGRTDADAPPPPRWTSDAYGDTEYRNTTFGDTGYGDARYRGNGGYEAPARGGEPSAWDEQALRAAAGVESRYQTEPMQLSSAGAGTLTATRPLGPAAVPARRWDDDVEDAAVEAQPIEAPAEIEVPTTPPPSAARRFLFGRSHVGLRVAAVAVLVVGSAVGIAVGVLNDSNPDTVKVTDDIQADSVSSAPATPDAAASQTQAAPVGAELMIKQRQQAALNAAQQRAKAKAAAVQQAAAAAAQRAASNRASRSESRSSSDSSGSGTGTTGTSVPSAPVDCKTYSGNRATGCALLQEFSFSTSQMSCLDSLWTRESQWTTTAENSSTGAYGIPQALPGSKMATVADDWKTNPATQIRWGLNYIKGRYSTPCGAWSHSESTGWY